MASPTPVATAFVVRDGRVLLLERAEDAPTFPGRWSGVSGIVEPGETPVQAAVREVAEETGLDVEVVRTGEPLRVDSGQGSFRVHPFRVRPVDPEAKVTLEAENVDHAWVPPEAIRRRPTVPALWETWTRVRS